VTSITSDLDMTNEDTFCVIVAPFTS